MAKTDLTVEFVRSLFHYDPETGLLWKRYLKVSKVAGCKNAAGYLVVGVGSRLYYVHRLLWLLHHGAWPEKHVDHINGNRSDNRLANLREATVAVNLQNQRTAQARNASGLLGVSCYKGAWTARICVQKKKLHLGTFASANAAHEAYLEAKRRLHEGNTL